jgi:chromosome segregation ATPase
VTTAFDGLVMMPLRETDVFSQTPVSALSIPPFGGPPGPAAAAPAQRVEAAEEVEVEFNEPRVNDLDPDDPEGLAAQDLPFDDDDGTPAPGAARPGDGRRAVRGGGGGSRRPPAYPAADPGAAPKRKRRWRIGKWGLLGVMIVCMVAVTLAMWVGWPMVFPNAATVTAAIKFDDRLASLPEGKRNQLLADQRQKLLSGEVRASAREILDRRYNVPAGFLAEAGTSQPELVDAARRYNAMVNGARLVEKKPVIELEHGTADAAGDRLRVRALLEALYSANKTMRDAAAQARVEYATAVRELERAKNRQDDLRAEMESARKELGERDVLGEKRNEVEALQEKDKELTDALVQASARVRALRADLLAAETSTPLDPDADPERLPALPQDDEQVVDMSRRVEELTASLAEKKRERAAKAEEANKALQAALGQFQQDIEQARGAMEPDSESELGRYLATAEKVQSRLRQLSLDLQQQQQTDMQRMTRLKEKLADKNAARIREAFAADGELQRLQEELALRERQHTTALGNGLRQDAAAITKQIQRLKREIGERQDLLTTAGGIGPDRETQEFLDETLARMAADRERNGRIMSEMLEELAGQAPAAGSLPAEQKKFAESLEQRQAALNDARERYNAAMSAASADADAELRRAEDELASVQAKIDERKKQVAEASRESMTQEQQRARLAATTRQQRQLDRAEEAERAAEAAYKDNVTALRAASNELEQLTARSGRFERESQRAVAVQQEISALGKRVAALQEAQETNVEPVPPEPDHVAVAAGPDHRREYILGANLALLFGFLVLVMLAPADPSAVGDEDGGDEVPFASASYDGARNGDGNGDGFDGDGNGDGARPSRQRDDETVSA